MTPVSIQIINSQHPYFSQVFALREKVLRRPLGLSLFNEDTSGDAEDDIFIALENDLVIGCLMSKNKGNNWIKLRQMAVVESWQGKGIGKLLMQSAESFARDNGIQKIELHARENAIGFYEKLGYKGYGEVFTEVTIPHLAMEKLL